MSLSVTARPEIGAQRAAFAKQIHLPFTIYLVMNPVFPSKAISTPSQVTVSGPFFWPV